MIVRSEKARDLGIAVKRFFVAILGISETGFIPNASWVTEMRATGLFNIVALGSSNREKAERMADEMPGTRCLDDWKRVVRWMYDMYGAEAVIAITAPTHLHAEMIEYCLDVGIRLIMVDKPGTVDSAEYVRVRAKAVKLGAVILVSYQHPLTAPSYDMMTRIEAHVANYGAESVRGKSRFRQRWMDEGTCENWRGLVIDGGLKDIWSHAEDGASSALNRPPVEIRSAEWSKERTGDLDKPNMDTGAAQVVYEGGIVVDVSFMQASSNKKHVDDIQWIFDLDADGTVTRLAWALQHGGSENLYIGDDESDIENIQNWNYVCRGEKGMSPVASALHAKQPGQHMSGWRDMWFWFFVRGYQRFLSKCGYRLADGMVNQAYGPCPTFIQNEGYSAFSCDAFKRCIETGETVTIEEMAKEHGIVLQHTPFVLSLPDMADVIEA